MTEGLKRFYGNGDLHFITTSCYHRQPLLATPERRDLLLTVLEHVRQRYGFVVVGYVVMPEHFHLLISEPEKANPSVVIQAMKLGFARQLLSSNPHLPSHIWQHRFCDFNVWSAQKRVEKLRYMHRNPIGCVKRLIHPRHSQMGNSAQIDLSPPGA
jgi:putative transposase